jgi:hypothetical protein
METFLSEGKMEYQRKTKKGKVNVIDLKKAIPAIEMVSDKKINITLSMEPGTTVRPKFVLEGIFKLDEESIKAARILKMETAYE